MINSAELASQLAKLYTKLQAEGFTRDEAWTIVQLIIKGGF